MNGKINFFGWIKGNPELEFVGIEWGLGTRDLRIVAAFWVGIPVSLA